MRDAFSETTYVREPSAIHRAMADPKLEVNAVENISTEDKFMYLLTTTKKDEFTESPCSSNIYVGIFTTSQARLHLYHGMETLQNEGAQVLYCDTDSIFYHAPEGFKPSLKIGDVLGWWKDELKGGKITHFVSCGPKNYAYQGVDGKGNPKTDCRIKGFTLNHANAEMLNLQAMRKLICSRYTPESERKEGEDFIMLKDQFNISRMNDHTVFTEYTDKCYAFEVDKRIIMRDDLTRPYGYDHVLEDADMFESMRMMFGR